ncbi:MAG: lipid II:glycine glycyltransferase FemX [Alkalispirochaeta sp.]
MTDRGGAGRSGPVERFDGETPSLLQSEWWRRVKAAGGWRAVATDPSVLQRKVGPFTLAYAPHAFEGNDNGARAGSDKNARGHNSAAGDEARAGSHNSAAGDGARAGSHNSAADNGARAGSGDLDEITAVFRDIGRRSGATLVRWDVPWHRDDRLAAALRELRWRPAPMRVQPPDTVIVPLDGSPEEILRRMKSKTRYNVRLAGKKGVSVTVATGTELLAALPEWYRLYRETALRDRITIHSEGYYRHVVESAEAMRAEGRPAPDLSLYVARHEGDLLGGIVVSSWSGTSTYLYGASSNTKRNLMANYLLQWEAMQGAIGRGDFAYDLFGIPESDDPDHPMHGLYRFKTGFGGEIVHRAGAWDLPIDTVGTAAYRTAERVRKWYYFRFRKATGGRTR